MALSSSAMSKNYEEDVSDITPLLSASHHSTDNVIVLEDCIIENDLTSTKKTWKEAKYLVKKSCPLFITYLLQYSLEVASVFSLGRLGSDELAASALGSMFAAVTTYSVGLGAISALDTLCSQAYTSRDPKMVSVHLQRASIIILLGFLPIGILWLNAEQILILLGQEAKLAQMAGVFLRYLLPGAPVYLLFEGVKKYLQAQGIMEASTYVLAICAPLNILLNYTLVLFRPLALGFRGAPLSLTITYWLRFILIMLYIRFINGYQVWRGWSRDCLKDWNTFIKLALPGIAMVCAQYWAFELVALAAGYLGSVALASHSIVLTTALLLYQMPYGLAIATSNRVGNLLGAGWAPNAELTANVAMTLAVFIGFGNLTVLITFKDTWGSVFTSDPDVIKMVAKLLPLCAAFQISEEINAIGAGILCGQGKQHIGAIFNVSGYYLIALALGLLLEFKYGWGIFGLWTGLTCASIIIAIGVLWTILKTDWGCEIERCKKRMKGIISEE